MTSIIHTMQQNQQDKINKLYSRDVQKTEILSRFSFGKTEPSKNLTSIQTVFRQKLHAICHSNEQWIKVTLLALNVQIKNVLKHNRNRV